MPQRWNVIIAGGGHNGLTAGLRLAREGQTVMIIEEKSSCGGASKTEMPFSKAPTQRASTGAYLLGLMPPEIPEALGIADELFSTLKLRDPHYFLPTRGHRHLLFGRGFGTATQMSMFFSPEDAKAYIEMCAELSRIRDALAPSFLEPALSLEETADRYMPADLHGIFINLCKGSVLHYLHRFNFKSELILAMFAITDGLSGLDGDVDKPGTGYNFLMHNMCRLPNCDGTWMRVEGGMGAVSAVLEKAFLKAGGQIMTDSRVAQILTKDGESHGVILADGRKFHSDAVIVNADPFRMLAMLEPDIVPDDYRARIESYRNPGGTLKLNLCLSALPQFSCLKKDLGQWNGTVHLIPNEERPLQMLRANYKRAANGQLPIDSPIEWYFDTNLRDENGNFSSALFVPGIPYHLSGASWDDVGDSFVERLLMICDSFAPGTSDLVVDRFLLSPVGIEKHFGITGGHIHHVPNTFSFSDRLPCYTPVQGLFAGGAGCHPGGSVTGAPGYVAAGEVIKYLQSA